MKLINMEINQPITEMNYTGKVINVPSSPQRTITCTLELDDEDMNISNTENMMQSIGCGCLGVSMQEMKEAFPEKFI
jgi:hypothetical protein